jgi:hypothetical protein
MNCVYICYIETGVFLCLYHLEMLFELIDNLFYKIFHIFHIFSLTKSLFSTLKIL